MKSLTLILFLAFAGLGLAQNDVLDKANDAIGTAKDKVDVIAENVNQDRAAQEASQSVLGFIDRIAERISFTASHWAAFMLLVAGVVNFGLQLTLGKLIMLKNMSFSLLEIISDGLAFAACVLGLVFVTQSSTEYSTFSSSAFSVLSAFAIGGILGLILFKAGLSLEVAAAKARKSEKRNKKE